MLRPRLVKQLYFRNIPRPLGKKKEFHKGKELDWTQTFQNQDTKEGKNEGAVKSKK